MRVVPRSCTHCSYRDRSRARGLCPGLHGSVEPPMWHRLMAAEDEPLSVGKMAPRSIEVRAVSPAAERVILEPQEAMAERAG
jgi:hypothetical protein